VNDVDPLVDKAVRLFNFLAKSQRLKERPIRDVEKYQRDGMVYWFNELPAHSAVQWVQDASDLGEPILTIDRLEKADPPEVPSLIKDWVAGDGLTPEKRPTLRAQIVDGTIYDEVADRIVNKMVSLDERHDVADEYDQWISRWDSWAEQEQANAPVRKAYKAMHRAHVTSSQNAEEFELVLALGLLTWNKEPHEPVRRHMFSVEVSVEIDSGDGSISLSTDSDAIGLTAELDMLEPSAFPTRDLPALTEERAHSFSAHALNRASFNELGTRTIFALDPEGKYVDQLEPTKLGAYPALSWSPALILRKRQKTGLAQAFEKIAYDIENDGAVPSGLRPLLDPGETPESQSDPSEGALLHVDGEVFSPLPLNQVQRRILERVDQNAQTLVQGPPGTGKTHTAAALLSHLLAQGKRVLVTAHTDRALHEVGEKLPGDIRPLAVSVVGSSRSDMAQLRTAVDTISRNSTEHDPTSANSKIKRYLEEVDDLRQQRQTLNETLTESRASEVTPHTFDGYSGTLAEISQAHARDADQFEWITEYLDESAPSSPLALTDVEATEWLHYIQDQNIAEFSQIQHLRSLNIDELPSPEQFFEIVGSNQQAATRFDHYTQASTHNAWEPILACDRSDRDDLRNRLSKISEIHHKTSQLHAAWISTAVQDIRAGIVDVWASRKDDVENRVRYVEERIGVLGADFRAEVSGDPDTHLQFAHALREYAANGNEIKTQIDGSVKIGVFSPGIVKKVRPFLEGVRINGRAPATLQLINKFIAYQEALLALERLDKSWPAGTKIPQEDTLVERVSWHRTQVQMLSQVLYLREHLNSVDAFLQEKAIPPIDWSDLGQAQTYQLVTEGATAFEELQNAERPLNDLKDTIEGVAKWKDSVQWIPKLLKAVETQSHDLYSAAYLEGKRHSEIHRDSIRTNELQTKLASTHHTLVEAIVNDRMNPVWLGRISNLHSANAWARTGHWLRNQESLDVNKLQAQIAQIEQRIQSVAEAVAAMRAWNHAVSKERLSPSARADLTQYSQLVRKLGKGTGKYAAQQRAEIREALDRCRPSVPVWIMPIYRVIEQLRISENMFDVVLIDEASQAGLEASFLQYLAPKIVVIGDDKQVSPAAVGVDQQALRDLADQYLHDDRYKASWQDPARSLFDEALMRYGGQLTLTEHRRCVPEIIQFSNRIAYEPNGIRLIPVRQFGADRIEPFVVTRTPHGFEEGASGSKINRAEARELVDTIKNCLQDPKYDGRTFGVIALLGTAQSNYIEGLLLDEVSSADWEERQLQVGSPPDFQGAERDVIFLSMVSSVEPGSRLAPLTKETYVQRYNVAVSRAKDQVWLFHTLTINDLNNEQDLRYQLLEYAYGVQNRGRELEGEQAPLVPDDDRVEGFDSLFEQRVYNRIADRGFTVVPQYETQGYRIDLVVVGANGRLAVECDGDRWHGPDAYARDLARQRDLERCGWTFFRVRESLFYADRAAALSPLWELLADLEIRPFDIFEQTESAEPEATERVQESTDSFVPPKQGLGNEASKERERLDIRTAVSPTEENAPFPRTSPSSEPNSDDTVFAAESYPSVTSEQLGLFSEDGSRGSTERAPIVIPPPPPAAPNSELIARDNRAVAEMEIDLQSAPDEAQLESDFDLLKSYVEYSGSNPPVSSATREEIIGGLLKIVEIEGPVTGARLQRAYVLSSGGQRVGRAIAKQLNIALTQATKSNLLLAENPLNQAGVKPRTYRIHGQPEINLRSLGPRNLDEVPPAELAATMGHAQSHYGATSDDDIMRYTLWIYGRKSLTQTVRETLVPVLKLQSELQS